ncbi:IS4 family transposase [Streptomyces sp. NPDC059949]|uniref:IS4 family transposase n=1 Tax=Streptomyces sp. NPDC059949 TaxID=3347013 RepID=UPI00365E2977
MEGWEPGYRSRRGILTKVFTPELVDAAVAKHGRRGELRRRPLPARLVVYFVLALCLFARESYEEVISVLTSGIPGSRALARVNRSSLCRARIRLGEEVLETVFRQVAGPLAVAETPGAWWRGLRLLALDGTQFDVPDSVSNGDTFDVPSTGGTPFGFPQVRAAVLAAIGTHAVLDAGLGGYRDGERRVGHPLASSTGPGDLVIADRGFWSVEFVHAFTASGAHLLVRLQSNHLGTTQSELPDGSRGSLMRPGKDARLRAAGEGRVLPTETTYRVITFTKDNKKVVHLGTSLLDTEHYPADELIALYRQRWEIELTFDEIKNHLGPGGPLRSRTPEAVRQELWALLAAHQAVRRFAHAAACRPSTSPPTASRPVPGWKEAAREVRSRPLPTRSGRDWPRAIKKPMRSPILRARSGRTTVERGRWVNSPTKKVKKHRGAGRPVPRTQPPSPPERRSEPVVVNPAP